jgi:very-short-patch-repair endonuclease
MPRAEGLIWPKLRGKRMLGYKFRRQYSVGPYAVDFYCPALKLAVEIDGDSHFQDQRPQDDQRRDAFVESFGIKFLRFTNLDVYKNLDGVLEAICQAIRELQVSPPYEGGDKGEVQEP